MPAVKPIFTEYDLGSAGWRTLHELARQRRRTPKDQARQLVLFALDRALAGEDVELSQRALEILLKDERTLEDVA